LILEHLCNLELLFDKDEIEVIIAPLKVHTDGAPARVYAKY
jgi:kynurenine formamidase